MIENPMAQATPDDSPSQVIGEKICDGEIIIGHGKTGHGMNGKDADLDRTGQFLVKSVETVDPIGAASMRLDLHCRMYATVTDPVESESESEMTGDDWEAHSVVSGGSGRFGGEWSGEEWMFGVEVTLTVPLSLDEYEDAESGECVEVFDTLAARAAEEIYAANKGGTPARDIVRDFEEEIGGINDGLEEIYKRLHC